MIKIQDQRTKLTFLEANDWVCVHRYLRRKKIKAKTSFKDSQGVLNLKIDKDIQGGQFRRLIVPIQLLLKFNLKNRNSIVDIRYT